MEIWVIGGFFARKTSELEEQYFVRSGSLQEEGFGGENDCERALSTCTKKEKAMDEGEQEVCDAA